MRVLSPETAYDAVRKAFYLAKLESRPIMLSAPMDTQQKTMDDDEEYVHVVGDSGRQPRFTPNPDSLQARRRHHRRLQQAAHHRRPRRDVVRRG